MEGYPPYMHIGSGRCLFKMLLRNTKTYKTHGSALCPCTRMVQHARIIGGGEEASQGNDEGVHSDANQCQPMPTGAKVLMMGCTRMATNAHQCQPMSTNQLQPMPTNANQPLTTNANVNQPITTNAKRLEGMHSGAKQCQPMCHCWVHMSDLLFCLPGWHWFGACFPFPMQHRCLRFPSKNSVSDRGCMLCGTSKAFTCCSPLLAVKPNVPSFETQQQQNGWLLHKHCRRLPCCRPCSIQTLSSSLAIGMWCVASLPTKEDALVVFWRDCSPPLLFDHPRFA